MSQLATLPILQERHASTMRTVRSMDVMTVVKPNTTHFDDADCVASKFSHAARLGQYTM